MPGRTDRTGHFYIEAKTLTHAIEMRAALAAAPVVEITGAEIDTEIEVV